MGVPQDIVKILGHWTLDSFLQYCRSLEIIAPMYVEMLSLVMSYLSLALAETVLSVMTLCSAIPSAVLGVNHSGAESSRPIAE